MSALQLTVDLVVLALCLFCLGTCTWVLIDLHRSGREWAKLEAQLQEFLKEDAIRRLERDL